MSELFDSNKRPPHNQPLEHQPIKVLIVDDQALTVESLRRLLSAEPDIEVHSCSDPTLALSVAADLEPSVILQDLVMPEVEGTMLVKFFRAHPKTKDTPIVVLSSKEDAKTKAAAFSAGANDYLVKLPDPIELVARLRYHSRVYYTLLRQDEATQTLAYNKALERRVEERTAELKDALNQLKSAQSKLIHTEKMQSMGKLVAGIAHEVNNPINFIYGNLNYVKGYVQDLLSLVQSYQEHYPSPAPDICEQLEQLDLEFSSADLLKSFVSLRSGAKRIRNLVLSLRNFSRFDESEIKTVDLHEGLESTLAMLSTDLTDVAVQKDYDTLPKIECCPGQLNQVFMHLIRNAAEALKKPRLFASAEAEPPSAQLLISTRATSDSCVEIWIVDNGPGISPEIQEQIFDPFFTTKEVGEGAGLGLSISYQIVTAQHGGQLKSYSVPGQGAKFCIELPTALPQRDVRAFAAVPARAVA
ncbi:MAG: response regulator [Cyanobacteria bacterium J06649_4]